MLRTDQDIIADLKRKLEEARWAVIAYAPDEFGRLLAGFDHQFNTEHDLWSWRSDVVAAVTEAVKRDEHGRAACPLCRSRGRSQSWGADGWLVPAGLAMHLRGDNNAGKCGVVDIAFKRLQDKHQEAFAANGQAKQEALAARLKTEPVLLIDPNGEPQLMAKTNYSNETPRASDWTTVDGRLREIGFVIETTGNVTTYRYMHGDSWMVVADPREAGKVSFMVFKRSGKYRWKHGAARIPSLQDVWKDWPAKFRKRLLEAIPDIGAAPPDLHRRPR